MSKSRLESLSDGVFAIVMTILVFDIHLPANTPAELTDIQLWDRVLRLEPVFASYVLTFVILSMFWLTHHYFYTLVIKQVNRNIVLLNLVYLGFLGLIPFSTRLLGQYSDTHTAIMLYGLNVFAVGMVSVFLFFYAVRSHEIDTSHITDKIVKQARARLMLMPTFAAMGILFSFVNISIARLLLAFPIVFNVVPLGLVLVEKIVKFDSGKY